MFTIRTITSVLFAAVVLVASVSKVEAEPKAATPKAASKQKAVSKATNNTHTNQGKVGSKFAPKAPPSYRYELKNVQVTSFRTQPSALPKIQSGSNPQVQQLRGRMSQSEVMNHFSE